MKKISVLFSVFLITNFCFGQDTIPKTSNWKSNNVIKTNLIGYIKNLTIFSYERVLSKNVSIMGTYGQGKYSISGQKAEGNLGAKLGRTFPCKQEVNLHSYISIEPRYYISFKHYKIPAGFHIGPSINFSKGSEIFTSTGDVTSYFINYGTETVTTEYKNTSFLINIGPQLLFKRLIALDISIGLGYGKTTGSEKNVYGNSQQYGSSSNFSYSGFAIAFSTSLGIAFGK